MGTMWPWMMMISIGYGLLCGNAGQMMGDVLNTGMHAVELTITLTAAMTLWSGMMEILQQAGDVRRMGKFLRRTMSPLFAGVTEEKCWEAMSLNLSANFLGLGNAAPPAGVRASQLLAAQGETGLRALAMLLALNNAGLQLMPTTVITLRQTAGAADPGGIWGVSAAAAAVSAVVSAGVLMLLWRREAEQT